MQQLQYQQQLQNNRFLVGDNIQKEIQKQQQHFNSGNNNFQSLKNQFEQIKYGLSVNQDSSFSGNGSTQEDIVAGQPSNNLSSKRNGTFYNCDTTAMNLQPIYQQYQYIQQQQQLQQLQQFQQQQQFHQQQQQQHHQNYGYASQYPQNFMGMMPPNPQMLSFSDWQPVGNRQPQSMPVFQNQFMSQQGPNYLNQQQQQEYNYYNLLKLMNQNGFPQMGQFQESQNKSTNLSEKSSNRNELETPTKKVCRRRNGTLRCSSDEKTMNSKNLLRAYQRAIFTYIKSNKDLCEKILGFPLAQLGNRKRQIMGNIQSISEIRNLWLGGHLEEDIQKTVHDKDFYILNEKEKAISKMVRIMSLKFLREEATSYFTQNNSQIKDVLKYRKLLIKFLHEPQNFIALML